MYKSKYEEILANRKLAKKASGNKFGAVKSTKEILTIENGEKKMITVRFDSKAEVRYYDFVIKPMVISEQIYNLEYHKSYEIQPAFEKNGKKYRKISYEADFVITYHTGRVEVVDVKGFSTDIFKLKQKLFEYKYPDMTIKLVMV